MDDSKDPTDLGDASKSHSKRIITASINHHSASMKIQS
jgi:hypothetical protein